MHTRFHRSNKVLSGVVRAGPRRALLHGAEHGGGRLASSTRGSARSADRRKDPWLVVTGYRAAYVDSDSSVPADMALQRYHPPRLDPLLAEARVDLVFSSHTHLTQRRCASFLGQCRMTSTFDPAAGANVYDSPVNPCVVIYYPCVYYPCVVALCSSLLLPRPRRRHLRLQQAGLAQRPRPQLP